MLGERLVDRVAGRELKLCSVFFVSVPPQLLLSTWKAQAAPWSHVSSSSNFPSIFVCDLGKRLSLLMPSVKTPVLCVYVLPSFAQKNAERHRFISLPRP